MTNSELGETTPLKDASNLINIQDELCAQSFYNPLGVTGYLTPLQRKKLREKRCDFSVDLKETSERENKKKQAVKRKKRTDTVLRDRSREKVKRMKTKENIPQLQCNISKIMLKKTDDNVKTKKFFKSSTPDRLNKANFTMSLVLKKNAFSNIDRSVKETLAHTRKLSQHKNKMCHSLYDDSDHDGSPDSKIIPLHSSEKENVFENDMDNPQTEGNLQQEKEDEISVPEVNKLMFEFNWPSDEELLKRREKARELARKKNALREENNALKCTDTENKTKEQNNENSQVKFYPIFQLAIKKQWRNEDSKRSLKNVNKKMKASSSGSEQMIIDAGQKEIGPKICSTCNMIYTIGEEEDERLHSYYHNIHVTNLKFPGWKEENMIGEYCDGRIIIVWNSDKSFKLKKIDDVLQVANRDLGFSSSAVPIKSDLAFLLFISNDKMVAGCIVAEPISKAFRVLSTGSAPILDSTKEKDGRIENWCSSSEAVPAVCGINRIWVAHNYRRQKVASRMVDCLRCHFIHGHIIGIREIAFTDPSPDGRQFAATYTGTSNFLVYK